MDGRYESDFHLWTQEQAAALRQAAADRVNLPLDWLNLAEELDSMGRSERHEIRRRLTVLLEHLLKLGYSPDVAPRKGWMRTVVTQRGEVLEALADSPSLRGWPAQVLDEVWRKAARLAALDDSLRGLPETCPFDLDAEILAEEFFPTPPAQE